jgi:two-component sensor histidine kinase
MEATPPDAAAAWPTGSGEMAARVRSHDWANTPLGSIEAWPQSLRTAVDICLASGFPNWVWWGRELIQIYNDAALAIVGAKHPAALGRPAAQFWPEIWPAAGPLIERVMSSGEPALRHDVPVIRDGGGSIQADFSFSALRNEAGPVSGLFIAAVETTGTLQAEAARRERRLKHETKSDADLLAELQHRVRNTLAVVRSIARRTAEASSSAEECGMHLDGRLSAFGRVQAAVTRNPIAGLDLEMLIADELLAVGAQEGERVTHIKGPKLRLQAKAAESLALAFHELATNAVKFGALSSERGRIAVEWTVESSGEPRLVLHWMETGMNHSGEPPTRRGFGTEFLQRTLAYDLDAETTWSLEPSGLRCTLVLPLTSHIVRWA